MKNRRSKAVVSKAKLAAYAATGAAAAACGVNSAEADITHVVVNTLVQDTTLNDGGIGLQLMLGDLASASVGLAHFYGTAYGRVAAAAGNFFGTQGASVAGFNAGAFNYASNVASGAPISALPFLGPNVFMTMAFNSGYTNSQFLNPGYGFIGLRFNGNQYGWVRVNMAGAPDNSFIVVDYAWADAGESINAGQITAVPEPGSLGMLALGAIGLAGWRRSRRAA